MVEHMSALQTTQHQRQQSFNGVQAQHWHHRSRPRKFANLEVTSDNSASPSHHRFSLFRWFKRRDSVSSADGRRRPIFRKTNRRSSTSSSSSTDTFYSTATVRSFAFHSGVRPETENARLTLNQSNNAVGPFAPGAVKLIEKRDYGDNEIEGRVNAAVTCTLPSAFSQKQDIQTRYSLLPVNSPFISCDCIPIVNRRPRTFAQSRLHASNSNNNDKNTAINADALTLDSSISGVKRVHVKGKRRAPDPPVQQTIAANAIKGNINPKPSRKGRRKRRQAPQPPGYSDTTLSSNQDTLSSSASTGMDSLLAIRDCQTISNDTLVLRRGVLLSKKDVEIKKPTITICDSNSIAVVNRQATLSSERNKKVGTLMPRPWYKRNIYNDHSNNNTRDHNSSNKRGGGDILRGISGPIPTEKKGDKISTITSTSSTMTSSFPFDGSLSRLAFFHRGDKYNNDDKKKENKRKSGVSILTNISELDKEAAAIVQQEQARNRASMILQVAKFDEEFEKRMGANEEIVQEIVNSSMESSPRRSTRALISKFNALGNITKVTVNSNFFTKSHNASPKAQAKRYSQENYNSRYYSDLDEKPERDLSKYFLPHRSKPKMDSASIFTERIIQPATKTTEVINTKITPKASVEASTETVISPKVKNSNNMELTKSLVAELDDVATGIARLRHELEERPTTRTDTTTDHENNSEIKKKVPAMTNKLNTVRTKELANFDKEFTKIFDEIDRQLKPKDSQIITTNNKTKHMFNANDIAISNQVAKVLDILVSAKKKATAIKHSSQPLHEADATNPPENLENKQTKVSKGTTASTIRISGVDDKCTAELKEMLKEMKHSLPKHSNNKKDPFAKTEAAVNKPSTSSYCGREEAMVLPKVSTKVSSGVQTSGNVRRIVNESAATVFCAASKEGKPLEEAITKNGVPNDSYRLIKPNEFAEIEALKVKVRPENTSANTIERSLYSNAQVAASNADKTARKIEHRSSSGVKIHLEGNNGRVTASPMLRDSDRNDSNSNVETRDSYEKAEQIEEIKKQCMNTLSVNRLLRKLEAAIASGHHQQAAGLAKELAQLKIHCSVVRQRSCNAKEKLNLSMYIEDKQAHQGPIPLQLPANITVAQLKAKIHIEFEIPANIQRWIIGKNLADNDESTLEELQAVEGSPVFLYLATPPDLQDKEAIKADKQREAGEREESEQEEQVINEKNDEQIQEIKGEIEPGPERQPPPAPANEPAAAAADAPTETKARPQAREGEETLSKEEKLKRYEELMSLENCEIISNTEPMECPVCFMLTIPGEGVMLRDCLHSFCRACVANTVRYCEEAEVRCPYRDADYTCESTLQEREIKALVAPEVYQQHLVKSIVQAENNAGRSAFHCKTPDCPGWCIYDDNVNNFLCPVCKANNCLTCQAIHMGRNCRQYQEELIYSKETDHESKRTAAMLEEMVDRGEALPCPTCAVVLMKKWGCDWLRCSMCKTEICWVTRGPRWGPAGKGDVSGGCRCGENGVKCHPRCNYCH